MVMDTSELVVVVVVFVLLGEAGTSEQVESQASCGDEPQD
jgi:hypothetical protein